MQQDHVCQNKFAPALIFLVLACCASNVATQARLYSRLQNQLSRPESVELCDTEGGLLTAAKSTAMITDDNVLPAHRGVW